MAPKQGKKGKKPYHIVSPLTPEEMKNLDLTEEDLALISLNDIQARTLVRSKYYVCQKCGNAAPRGGKCTTCGYANCCE